MSEKPQIEHKGNESTESDGLVAGKLMETEWIFNSRGLLLKITMLTLFVVLWLCHDQIDTWLHDHKEVAYQYDECIGVAHCYIRKGWVIIVCAMVWLITIIDELRYRKWFWSAALSCIGILYYYVILIPCGPICGHIFIILVLGSAATLVLSMWKRRHLYSEQIELLGRGKAYNEILEHVRNSISDTKRTMGVSMAIIGDWGTGKTHCLQFLKYKLTSDSKRIFRICEVDLWQLANVDEAFKTVASELEYALTGHEHQNNSSLIYLIESVLKGIFSASGIWENTFNQVLNYINNESKAKQAKLTAKLSKKVEQECKDGGVVLILDNIERANEQVLENMLPLIEKMKEIKRMAVICGIDTNEIKNKEPLYNHGRVKSGIDGYLSKLFDYQYALPEIGEHGMIRMQDNMFRKLCASNRVRRFISKNRIIFETPRQIERVLTHLCYIDRCYINDMESNKSNYIYNADDNVNDKKGTYKFYCWEWGDNEYNCDNIFFVAILQLLYKEICDDILSSGDLKRYIYLFYPVLYKHSNRKEVCNLLEMTDRDMVPSEYVGQWDKSHPKSANIIKRDCLAWSVVRGLLTMSNDSFYYCFEHRYERSIPLKGADAAEIIKCTQNGQRDMRRKIDRLIIDKFSDHAEDSKKFLLSYASHSFSQSNDYLLFVKRYLSTIFNDADDITMDIMNLRNYAISDVFLMPFVVNLCRAKLDNKYVKIARMILTVIVNGMSFSEVAKSVRDFYWPIRSQDKRLIVKYNPTGDSINVEGEIRNKLYVFFLQKLSKTYLSKLICDLGSHDSVLSYDMKEHYKLYDVIDNLDSSNIFRYTDTKRNSNPSRNYARCYSLLHYIVHHISGGSLPTSFGSSNPCVSKNQYLFSEIILLDITQNDRLTECESKKLDVLLRACENSIRTLSESKQRLDALRQLDRYPYIDKAISLLNNTRDYLRNIK